ncbi:MAG: hypothetical protein MR406_07615 [Blautia sp.]|nr:hypothetical protein [Blautia sp.]
MKKNKRRYDEVNYWESMADSLVGLLLCILLITFLLILYLVRIPDEEYVDLEQGDSYEQYDDAEDGGGNHSYGVSYDEEGDEWEDEQDYEENNGGGGNGGDDADQYQFEDPDPGVGEGDGTDRAAVFVQVVDAETGRTVKKSGLEFELYGANSSLQVLSTYYPKKIDYKKYETDETGVFYLPEKLPLSSYYLHGLSAVDGYDTADKTEFTIDDCYDWSDPYVVTVALYPSKNIIRMKLVDLDNGEPVAGASFDVVAAENIVTQDGTIRYKEGDVVDTINVDEEGYGESTELYLGNYLLRQTEVPEYYAKNTADTVIQVKSKTETGGTGIRELTEEKTSVNVTLTDALYETTYLSGAGFTLSSDDESMTKNFRTDEEGRFTVKDLKKNTTYHIRQVSTTSDYQADNADYSFTVNGEGMIDGEKEANFQIRNRIIRISIGVQDKLFRGQVSDVNAALCDTEGNVIRTWNTTGLEQTIEGLKTGEYTVILDGDKRQENKIVVEDKTEIQNFQFERWTTADLGVILALCLFIIGFIAFMVIFMRRAHQRKPEDKE